MLLIDNKREKQQTLDELIIYQHAVFLRERSPRLLQLRQVPGLVLTRLDQKLFQGGLRLADEWAALAQKLLC